MTPQKEAGTIRLLLVDDHALFLEGVERLLQSQIDFTVVAATPSIAAAQHALSNGDVDVILLDFDFGRESATPFVQQLREKDFPGRILIVTAGISQAEAVQLVRAGVAGIFHKHHGSHALCDAIRTVGAGQPYLEPAYLGSLFASIGPGPEQSAPRLSDREARILRLIFQGLVNKEIAAHLGMSESGVKSALRGLFHKIGVKTRSQAVRVALEQYQTQL